MTDFIRNRLTVLKDRLVRNCTEKRSIPKTS